MKLAKILIPVVAAGGLAAGAFYWMNRGSAHSLNDLARETPQQAVVWMAAEMRDEQSAATLSDELQKLRKESTEVEQFAQQLEKRSGHKLDQLLKIYAASGFMAIYAGQGAGQLDKSVDILLECQLYDAAGARQMIKQKGWKEEAYAGQTLYTNSGSWCCVSDRAIMIGSSRGILERAIDAAGHKNTLDRDPQFQQALARLPGLSKSNGMAIYCDFGPCWNSLEKVGGQHVDAGTVAGLRTVPYLVGGLMKKQGSWLGQGFLAIDSKTKNSLAQALLKTPSSAAPLAAVVPEQWGYFQGFDLIYSFDLLVEMIRLVPRGRMGVGLGLAYIGLLPGGARDKAIRQAFSGDAAWTFDLDSALLAAQSTLARGGRPSLAAGGHFGLMFGLKDVEAARKLLQPLPGQKVTLAGREGFQLSHQGSELCWMFLDRPAALLFSAGPKGQESLAKMVECANGKAASLARRKDFSAFASSYGAHSALVSYLEMSRLAEGLKGSVDGLADSPGRPLLKSLLSRKELLVPDRWSVQVEKDGLRLTNQGSAAVLGLGGAGLAAIASPNFTRARGRGQLTACKSNEKNIATALEMWSSDNGGRYPERLSQLQPGYLKTVPTCPAGGADTYSGSYTKSALPDKFNFCCQGAHHAEVPANYPQYQSDIGLIERP